MSTKNWFKFILLSLMWGSTFLWLKIAVQEIRPLSISTLRFFISLIFLLIFVILIRKKRLNKNHIKSFIILGILNAAGPSTLLSWGEQFIPSWLASILVSSVPFLTTLIASRIFSDEKITARKILGLLVGFSGIMLLLINPTESINGQFGLGVAAVFGAVLCFSISNVYSRKITTQIPSQELALGQISAAFSFSFLAAMIFDYPIEIPALPMSWLAILALGILNGGIGFLFFFSLIKDIGSSRTSMITFLFPLIGAVLGILILGETPTWQLLVGGPVIIAGVLIFNSKRQLQISSKI